MQGEGKIWMILGKQALGLAQGVTGKWSQVIYVVWYLDGILAKGKIVGDMLLSGHLVGSIR